MNPFTSSVALLQGLEPNLRGLIVDCEPVVAYDIPDFHPAVIMDLAMVLGTRIYRSSCKISEIANVPPLDLIRKLHARLDGVRMQGFGALAVEGHLSVSHGKRH
jgi:hypothetical protein